MSFLKNFLFCTIPQFFRNTQVRQEVCKIAQVCGGGSGGAVDSVNGKVGVVVLNASDVNALPDTYTPPDQNLQQVTTGPFNNVTSNLIQIQGVGNFEPLVNSAVVGYNQGFSRSIFTDNGGTNGMFINKLTNTLSLIGYGGNLSITSSQSTFNTPVSGADAVNAGDFITKQQSNLQNITTGTGNNITSNTVQVTASDNFSVQDGTAILYTPGTKTGTIAVIRDGGASISQMALRPDGFELGNSTALILRGDTTFSTPFIFQNNAVFERVAGADATQPNDFVTLQQLQNNTTLNTITQSNENLSPGYYYTYNGTADVNWTLPALTDGVGTRIGILNDSTFTITLNSEGGANDIVDSGAKLSTVTISAGAARIIYNNSLNWYFLT